MAQEVSGLTTASLTAQAAAIRAREVSSRELLQMYLQRRDKLGAEINAVVTVEPERAFAEAARADELTAQGRSLGPLHGVPFTVKDALMTEGIRSTGGSPEMSEHVPDRDAVAVHRLRAAGGVLFGKTNTPLWCGDIQTHSEVFGVTNNPWRLDRTTGGSSGGSAAAVASGLTAFEVGTDIGGSLRIPAHFCGIYSHKPTYGIVPQRGYIDQLGGNTVDADVNVIGPMARAAEDLELLLEVMVRKDADDRYGWSVSLPPGRPELRDCRVALWPSDPNCPPSQAYAQVLGDLAGQLRGAGVRVTEAHPDVDFLEQVELWLQIISGSACVAYPEEVATELGGSHIGFVRASERRVRLTEVWKRWFDSFDLLLCPVWPREAFEHNHEGDIFSRTVEVDGSKRLHVDCGRWVGLIGVVGLPSTVVPIGSIDGLPVGVQVVAPHLHDLRSIRAAAAIGALTGGYHVPPGYA